MKSIGHKSLVGVISYSVRSLLLYAVAIVATAILSAYLNPQEFGIYYIVLSVMGIFTFFSDIGLAASLIQKKEEPTVEELRSVFSVQLILGCIIFCVSLLAKDFFLDFLKIDQSGYSLLIALTFSFVLASFKTIPSILLERKLQFDRLVYPQIAEQIVFYTIAVWSAVKGQGVNSFTLAVLARSFAGLGVIYWLKPWPIGLNFKISNIKQLIPFGFKFQLNDLLARIKDDLYIVLIAKFIPANVLGILGWAKRWSMFPYQFAVASVVSVTFPTMARVQSEGEKIALGINKAWLYVSSLIFWVLLTMCISAELIVKLVPVYAKWEAAILPLYFYALNIAIAALANPAITLLNATGEINKTLKIMMEMTAITYMITWPFYMWWGLNGLAAVAVFSAAMGLWAIKLVSRSYKTQFWKQVLPSIIATASTFGLLRLWLQVMPPSLPTLVGLIVISLFAYLGIFAVIMNKRLKEEYIFIKTKLTHASTK